MSAERSGEGVSSPEFDLSAVVSFGQTDVGRVRSVNQDAFAEWSDAERPARLFFVADGMGGHRGGEVASQLAVEHVGRAFAESRGEPRRLLQAAFQRANSEIFGTASRDFELAGMGTTGVALLLDGAARGYVAHVGDSRVYRLRDGVFEALTGDHSVVGELVRRGQLTSEEARLHPQSNEILRAIGTQPQVEVEIAEIDVRRGDLYLLCSDGLSGMLSDPDIGRVLESAPPGEAVEQLIRLANEAGGTDNITVQIAGIPATAPPAPAREARPSGEAAASGSLVRWAVALGLLAALLLLLLLGGSGSGG